MIQAILSFDVDAETPILVEGRRHAGNAGVMSHQAYGPLVGVPRSYAFAETERFVAVVRFDSAGKTTKAVFKRVQGR